MIGRKTHLTPDVLWEQGKYKKLPIHSEEHLYVSPLLRNDHFYGEDQIARARTMGYLLVTEGVTDQIAAGQAGFPSISLTTTTISHELWPRFLHLTELISSIYLCFDNEVNGEGEAGAIETARRLFSEIGKEAYVITLPRAEGVDKIDVNDYLKVHSPAEY